MKPIYRNENTAVFRNEYGRLFGLREIGNRKSWYRWQTPDGKRHRFAKDACAYLDGQQLRRSYLIAKERNRIQEERARIEWTREFRSLATRWRTGRVQVNVENLVCQCCA